MELKGKYSVVSVGEALCQLIKKADLTLSSGSIKFNLSKLICLNKRRTLANTLLRIIYIYNSANNLFSNDLSIETFTDDLLNECFAMEIPAKNFLVGNKIFSMDKAIVLKLISKKINTFETIKTYNDKFDRSNLLPRDLNQLMILNSSPLEIKLVDDDSIATYISEDEVERLIKENRLIHQIFVVLRSTSTLRKRLENCKKLSIGLPATKIDQNKKVSLVEFIQVAIEINNNLIINELCKDENVNLLYAIIKSDFDLVSNCLKIVDPRFNNNEYYLVALQIGNEKIINYLRDTILINTWLEKQVLINGFELIETSNSYLDITLHMKNTIYA